MLCYVMLCYAMLSVFIFVQCISTTASLLAIQNDEEHKWLYDYAIL